MRDGVSHWRVLLGRSAAWLGVGSLVSTLTLILAQPREGAAQLLLLPLVMAGAGFFVALPARRVAPIALCAFAGLMVVIVEPILLRACCGSNEASAIGALREIHSGQVLYESVCANGGFATDLGDLARASSGGGTGFVPPDLNVNGVVRRGYIITLAKDAASGVTDVGSPAKTCNGSVHQPASSYFASANPVTAGVTGTHYFAIDKNGAIAVSTKGPVANPIQLGPDVQSSR